MKMIVAVALALVAVASALPAEERPIVGVVSQESTQDKTGYKFGYETEDGSKRSEEGKLKDVLDEENKPHQVVTVRGTYSYFDKDGNVVETINYYADENGYHAEGPSVPKASRR